MTDHHEEFAADKVEEQLDILFQVGDAVTSPFPQPGKRLIQDLHTLSTYALDKQADQASVERVQQRLQLRISKAEVQRSNDDNKHTMRNTITVEDYQKRNTDMQKLFSQRNKNAWIGALVAVLILGLCIGILAAFLNIHPLSNVAHPNVVPTAIPTRSTQQQQVTPGATPAPGTATPTTAQLPAVQTSCPASGTVRLPVMTPMTATSHSGILYTSDFVTTPSPHPEQIRRYDVTTGTTNILFTANAEGQGSGFGSVLVSANEQWITFMSVQNGVRMIQLMRADGQELQTLYCTSDTSTNLNSWSPNQHYLILSDSPTYTTTYTSPAHLTMIDLTNGSIREILEAPQDVANFEVVNWVGNTGIYVRYEYKWNGDVTSVTCNKPMLYLLSDVTKDTSQQATNLQSIPLSTGANTGTQCPDFSVSPDSSQLLLDNFTPSVLTNGRPVLQAGPSTLSLRPIQGGNAQIINDAPTHNIDSASFVTNSMVWFIISNPATNSGKNGLWVMNTDSTGLTCLISEQATGDIFYVDMSFSQDAQNFAVRTITNSNESLVFGSLNGGTQTTIATAESKEALNVIGWTQF